MGIEGFVGYRKEDADKYNALKWWLGITFGDMLDKAADLYPKKEALVDGDCRLTYSQLRDNVNRLASGLVKLGLRKNDMVLLQLPNWSEYVYSYFALMKIGAIPVLLIPRHGQIEINHLCRLTKARAWILPEKYHDSSYLPLIDEVLGANPQLEYIILTRAGKSTQFIRLEKVMQDGDLSKESLVELAKRRPDPMEVAEIMPSGGTTGLPKAAARTHCDVVAYVEYRARAWERNNQDICLIIGPLGHGQTLNLGVCGTILTFGKIVLMDSIRPEDICSVIERERVTHIPTLPTLAMRLIKFEGLKRYDLSSLKSLTVGGSYVSPDVIKSVREQIGCECLRTFGMVEGPQCITRPDDDLETILNTCGRPCCPYDQFKVIDQDERELPPNSEGGLVAKGPCIFAGYFESPEENKKCFTKDGFFKTGDLAIIDNFGNITITGRSKDIIIRGGENIYVAQVEELLRSHPSIDDVAVVGMPDEDLGERICAYVVPNSGVTLSFGDIISFLLSKGASKLMLPERIEFINSIPLTKVGKPDKKALRGDIRKRLGMI